MDHEEVDNGFIDALVCDTEKLLKLLAVDVSGIKFDIGSERYQRVSLAFEQLSYALRQPGVRLETTELPHNGRNGKYLMDNLHALKEQLNAMGEGAKWKGVASA